MSTIILARLLVPADFGIMAMAMSVVFALELLNAFGFEVALIQKNDVRDVHYNTAWTYRILFSTAAALLLIGLAAPAATFYEQPGLRAVILVLAAGTFITGWQNIGTVAFLKDLQLEKEFRLRFLVKIVGFSITVPLAFYLRSYWAMLAGVMASRATTVLLSYLMHSYRPRFSFGASRELFSFSIWLFLSNILFFLRMRSADFVIGKLIGPSQLGLFSVANEIAELPVTEVVMPINRAAFPGYSKVANDQAKLRLQYIAVFGMVCLIAFPAGLGVAAIADIMIPALLGQKWLDSVELIKIMALNAALVVVQVNIGSIYLALGRPKLSTYVSAAHVVVLIPLLIALTAQQGAVGAAWAYFISSVCVAPVNYYLLLRLINLRLSDFIKALWRPLLAAGAMYTVVQAFVAYVGVSDALLTNGLHLGLGVLIGAGVFSAIVLILWLLSGRPEGAETEVLDWVRSRLATFQGKYRAGKNEEQKSE